MSNNYFNFPTPFIPGLKVRSGEVNPLFVALEAAFDMLPSSATAIRRGQSTFGVESGSGNAYVVTLTDPRVARTEAEEVVFRATHANTSAATLDVDGTGAVALRRFDGVALQANDILNEMLLVARYDSLNSRWSLVGPSSGYTTSAAASAAASAVSAAEALAYRNTAQQWAVNPEDDDVDGYVGEFSALHWAAKAAASAAEAAAFDPSYYVEHTDFSSNGILSRTGAGTYAIITDASADWNTAFGWGNHASQGYTTNTGTVTSVGTGTGLTGGAITTTGTIDLALNALAEKTGAVVGTDRLVGLTGTTHWAETISGIPLSAFNNDLALGDGTVTSVATGTGLTGGAITTTGTVSLELNALAEKTGDLVGTDRLVGVSGTTHFAETFSNIPLSIFNNDLGAAGGTVTSVGVVAGVGLTVSGSPITTSGDFTMAVDLNELTTSTADGDGDYFVVVDTGGAQKKLTKANIALSGFNNDSAWTGNTGTVTSVAVSAGEGLTVSGSPITTNGTFTMAVDLSELTSSTTNSDGAQFIVVNGATQKRLTKANILLSGFSNDSGWTANPGTVTSIVSGNGMNFTTITSTGTVTMGTPSTLTAATSNAVTTTSHTHAITGFLALTGGTVTGATTLQVGSVTSVVTTARASGSMTIYDPDDVAQIVGYRNIPGKSKSTYTLGSDAGGRIGDIGKVIFATGNVTLSASLFQNGDAISIINHSASPITLVATGVTLYNMNNGDTGNRTLAARAGCTVVYQAATVAYVGGGGIT